MTPQRVQQIVKTGMGASVVKRYDSDMQAPRGMERNDKQGYWVEFSDYQSLQAALREALDGWEAEMHADLTGHQRKRIDALRAKFLDDK